MQQGPDYRKQGLGSIILEKTRDSIKNNYPDATHIIGEPCCIEQINGKTEKETLNRLQNWYKKMGLIVQENGKILYSLSSN